MKKNPIVFIINPKAATGVVSGEWLRIKKSAEDMLGPFDAFITDAPGNAEQLTRRNLIDGAEKVICVGGDGTLNEVVNGFFDNYGAFI